jgi:hypothetical protein
MEPKSYPMLLAEYGRRFEDTPPSILSEEGAAQLMHRALLRGRQISGSDLTSTFREFAISPAA